MRRGLKMSTLYKKFLRHILLLILFSLSMPVLSVQDVYQYENEAGVKEFTDRVKLEQAPKKHIQIENTSAEQEAAGKARLDEIIRSNEEYDKKIAEQKRLENERLRYQQEINSQNSKEQAPEYYEDDNRYGYYGRYYRPRPGHPIERPKPKPKPVHPIERPKPVRPQLPNPSHPFTPIRAR